MMPVRSRHHPAETLTSGGSGRSRQAPMPFEVHPLRFMSSVQSSVLLWQYVCGLRNVFLQLHAHTSFGILWA